LNPIPTGYEGIGRTAERFNPKTTGYVGQIGLHNPQKLG